MRNDGESQVLEIEYICQICEQQMTAVPAPSEGCTENCPKHAHAHIRCEQCSPPGWFAVATFKGLFGREPYEA